MAVIGVNAAVAQPSGADDDATAADGWRASMPAGAVATYIPDGAAVLVVAAGDNLERGGEAAAALRAAFAQREGAPLVMDGAAVGDVSALPDSDIVARATHLPVDRLAIVRVFVSGEAASARAVVSLYDRDGRAHGAFSVREGEALGPAVETSEPPATSPKEGTYTVPVQTRVPPEPEPQPDESTVYSAVIDDYDAYRRNRIWFRESVAVNLKTGWVTHFLHAAQGDTGVPLDGADFYRVVGRDDLAARYTRRKRLRRGMLIGGGVAALGGVVLASWPSPHERCLDEPGNTSLDCVGLQGSPTSLNDAGDLVAVGGFVAFFAGLFYNPHPVSVKEAVELADAYNESLRAGRANAGPRPGSVRGSVSLAPVATLEGVSLMLLGRF